MTFYINKQQTVKYYFYQIFDFKYTFMCLLHVVP